MKTYFTRLFFALLFLSIVILILEITTTKLEGYYPLVVTSIMIVGGYGGEYLFNRFRKKSTKKEEL